MSKENEKLISTAITLFTASLVLILAVTTFTTVTRRNTRVKTAETVITALYKYSTLDALMANADYLETICEPEVFSILDNRDKAILFRRFSTYVPTSPSITHTYVEGNTVICVVSFNKESNLNDKLIYLEFNSKNILCDYKEYEFKSKFDERKDFITEYNEFEPLSNDATFEVHDDGLYNDDILE